MTGQLATAVANQQAAQDVGGGGGRGRGPKRLPAEPTRHAAIGAPTVATIPAPTTPGHLGRPVAPPAGAGAGLPDPALNPFLQCVVQAESGGNYGAVSPDGLYMGAFQFSQSTWNSAAQAAGLPDLVGVPPNLASKADQDTVAVALYALDGQQPWLGDRCVVTAERRGPRPVAGPRPATGHRQMSRHRPVAGADLALGSLARHVGQAVVDPLPDDVGEQGMGAERARPPDG